VTPTTVLATEDEVQHKAGKNFKLYNYYDNAYMVHVLNNYCTCIQNETSQ